jgi:hypothetical protein
MTQYTDGSGWSAVQMVGILLTARPGGSAGRLPIGTRGRRLRLRT